MSDSVFKNYIAGEWVEGSKGSVANISPADTSDLIGHYLHEAGGNVSAAARLANIPRRTFYRMLERHKIDGQSYRGKQ